VPANLPSAVEDICKALMSEEEIEAVDIGRQVSSSPQLSMHGMLAMGTEGLQSGTMVSTMLSHPYAAALCLMLRTLAPLVMRILPAVYSAEGHGLGPWPQPDVASGWWPCKCSQASRGLTPIVMFQVEEKRAVSQDLQLWISKEAVQGGYNLVVRTGRLVQEIHVTTQMPGDRMKQAVQRVLRNLV
jgi:hypothetical protein